MLGRGEDSDSKQHPSSDVHFAVSAPKITLPKGGGAISGIGEKFAANPVTGTGAMTVPLFASPSRSGFGPQLSLSYDSGAGNGIFGFGWSLSLPSITRRTDKGLPKYFDAEESDIFILSGAEDLVPLLVDDTGGWHRQPVESPATEPGYVVQRYRPRIEGLFARIERWTDKATGISHWRSISRDNVTTLYGARDDARVAHPSDPTRVFTWLICESYDDRGNALLYRYKQEDDSDITRYVPPDRNGLEQATPQERNRLIAGHFPQRYIKTIQYGNRSPRTAGEDLTLRADWLFEVVFDYGEHDAAAPTTQEIRTWPVRQDPFSLFRSTFDIRTYRLCRRVLMFHHFPDELKTADCLVRSTELEYKETSVATFVVSVTQAGHALQADGTYLKRALPKLEFKYTDVAIDETVRDIDADSIRNLPDGVDAVRYRWVDLDSEGLTGVLTEQAHAWYYKRNLGDGTFGAVEQVTPMPSLAALSGGRQQLLDLAGEGHLDLVQYDRPMAGFYRRRSDGGWGNFTPFKSVPTVDTKDPNLRFIDLTGDGFPDILISEDTVFTWYESLAKDGFDRAKHSPRERDEEKGPRLVLSDPTESIFLADMVGDGLSDLVRIRLGEVCYWPNLGYGRFGAKVTMGNAPLFENQDLFDPRRIHLADIDGSGNADIIYIGHGKISLYFNQSGNFWSPARDLSHYPKTDNVTSVAVLDLLGNGTACLVWSSPHASDAREPMRYIDLMGGQKPHLLVYATNNMGAETEISYVASTQFYLQDRRDGRRWVTKLPFPVHVVERTESRDLVSNTTLVSTYRYRHGYYDGVEREFRGFAYVERRDAESVVGQFDLPPIVTKTWFHNGAYLKEARLEAYFKSQEFFSGDAQASFLPDTALPPNLTDDEMREAARALKGSVLRQELYSDDGSPKAALPYSVSEGNFTLTCLQPRGPNRHAVFFTHARETLDYHYERNPADPRISHALTLAVDEYGNVLKSAAIGYPRRAPVFDEQKLTLATLIESQYTNIILNDDAYRTPLLAEAKTYELTAPALGGAAPLDFATVDSIAAAASEIPYEAPPSSGQTQKRLIARLRTLYRKDDLSDLLPKGTVESMGLPGESYKLALTPGLLDIFQSKATRAELTGILTGADVGYRDLDGDGDLWIPSGRAYYSPGPGDTPAQELAFATAHFFLPHRFRDAFGYDTLVTYDTKYTLFPVQTRDPVGNETSADYDCRVLQPVMVTDPNGNRVAARFDALGMLAGTAVMGKATGAVEGDSFADFTIDLAPADITAFFAAADPRALALAHLGTATTRVIYDLDRVPVCATSIARETHVSDLASGAQTKLQLHFVYSDGFGREAQTKAQAEPGLLDLTDPHSLAADPRWVATGEKVYNNKGKPVRQYEPFFSATPQFGIETWGVSGTLFYDPIERVVATLHPNYTFDKVVFDPWQQTIYDVNDTVTLDPKADPDVGEFFNKLPDTDYLPTWYTRRAGGALGTDEQDAAAKAASHADTPSAAHFDTLGRTFLTIADNGKDQNGNPQKYQTRSVLDIEGHQREIIDALGRTVMRYDYDLPGGRIHQASMEAGERFTLNDVAGKPVRAWNSRKYAFQTLYDAVRRPLQSLVQGGDPSEPNPTVYSQPLVYDRAIYGDSADTGLTEAQQQQANLKTKVFKHFDGAGIVTTDLYDFKGNVLRAKRQFASDYKNAPDWSQNPALDSRVFTGATVYDALNRAIAVTTPDSSVYHPTFNEAGLLEKIDVNLRGASPSTPFVTNIDYNAKGQRTLLEYGNGAKTEYSYDAQTFRLIELTTTRAAGQNGTAAQIFKNPATLQDLRYAYDPVGNITRIGDAALITVFNGQQVDPVCDYTYDPLYRLTDAKGREHIGQSGFAFTPQDGNNRDYPFVGASALNDLTQLRNYTEHYGYDPVGNFQTMVHVAGNGAGNWTRTYTYSETSLLEPAQKSNRLSQTALQAGVNPPAEPYKYDAHGNTVQMPHLPVMQWNLKDELSVTSRQVVNEGTPETTYYVYDAAGRRARKITELQNGKKKNERVYLRGYELHRECDSGGGTSLERETLHVMDDKQCVALIETQTIANSAAVSSPRPASRYQLTNHLDSTSLELDENGGLISYEQYSPYGNTTFEAGRSAAEVSLKRYRYTGMERDEESGLYYSVARYYVAWLSRWLTCDPIGVGDRPNLYLYARDNPVNFTDQGGKSPDKVTELENQLRAARANEEKLGKRFEELVTQQGQQEAKADIWTREIANLERSFTEAEIGQIERGEFKALEQGTGKRALIKQLERAQEKLADAKAALKKTKGALKDLASAQNKAKNQIAKLADKVRKLGGNPNAAPGDTNLGTADEASLADADAAAEGEDLARKIDTLAGKKPPGGGGAGVKGGGGGPVERWRGRSGGVGASEEAATGLSRFARGVGIAGRLITAGVLAFYGTKLIYHMSQGDADAVIEDDTAIFDFFTFGGFSYAAEKTAKGVNAIGEGMKAAQAIRDWNEGGGVPPPPPNRESQQDREERRLRQQESHINHPFGF